MKKSTHTKDYAIFLTLLISARHKSGLTQVQLGNRLPFGQPGISKIERGERRVDVVELRMICQEIGIKFEDFVKELEAQLVGQHHE